MIEITTHVRSVAAMRATAAYLNALAVIAEAEKASHTAMLGEVNPQSRAIGAIAGAGRALAQQESQRIAPEDNPEAGVVPSLAEAAAAFGAPAALVPSVPLPPPVVSAPAAPSSASATAPVPSVAPAPVAGGSVNAAGKQLDSRGIPHDGRIHSTPPSITAEGVWRKKRGLNDLALVQRVEAELLAGQAVPVPPPPIISAAGAAVGLPSPTDLMKAHAEQRLDRAVPAAGPTDLAGMMQQVAPLLAAQRIDMARVLEACKAVGVDSLTVLQSRPDLVPAVWTQVWQRVTQ